MAESRHDHPVRIPRVHQQVADVRGVRQPDRTPRRARVVGAVDTFARHDVEAGRRLTGSGIEDASIGGRDGQRTDGGGALRLQAGPPGAPGVRGLPDPATSAAKVKVSGSPETPVTAVAQPARNGPTCRQLTSGIGSGEAVSE